MVRLWLIRVVVPAVLIVGIGLLIARRRPAPEPDIDVPSEERLHLIGLAINSATHDLGRPPRDLDELRPFLREHGHPDRLLVSPTDGQPYVVHWGTDVRSAAYNTVLAYERSGAAGKRFVLTPTAVVQLTDAELAEADFPAGFQPPGRR